MKPPTVFNIVRSKIEEFLTPHGFERSGSYFRKMLPDGESCHSICIQCSKYSTAETCKFTFEAYAEWKQRPAWYTNDIPHQKWYGAQGNRIGPLMPERQDHWWEVSKNDDLEQFGKQICDVISKYAIPFLSQFESRQQLERLDRKWAFESRLLLSYVQAVTRLSYDLKDKKPDAVIRNRIRRVWFAGRVGCWGVSKPVIEETIQQLLHTHGRTLS